MFDLKQCMAGMPVKTRDGDTAIFMAYIPGIPAPLIMRIIKNVEPCDIFDNNYIEECDIYRQLKNVSDEDYDDMDNLIFELVENFYPDGSYMGNKHQHHLDLRMANFYNRFNYTISTICLKKPSEQMENAML